MRGAILGLLALLLTTPMALAKSVIATDTQSLDVDGDLKLFLFGTRYYENDWVPQDPLGQGAVDFRLKVEGSQGDWLNYAIHHQTTTLFTPGTGGTTGANLQNATVPYPQVVDLSWSTLEDVEDWQLAGRIDRLELGFHAANIDITVGRQAISFGKGYFFTPMDLITPFNPAFVDKEYKPGIDALRFDAYGGDATKITLVLAYTGDWFESEDWILATRATTTYGLWDIGVFASHSGEEWVLGLETAGSLGIFAIRAEGTYTVPDETDPFFRGMMGADLFLSNGLSLISEVYVQTLGTTDPAEYLLVASDPRFARGEVWNMGKYYGALSASYTITPLLSGTLFSVVNLTDPSAMLGPSLGFSLADNATLALGAYTGLGARPNDEGGGFMPESEFGLLPTTVFFNASSYF